MDASSRLASVTVVGFSSLLAGCGSDSPANTTNPTSIGFGPSVGSAGVSLAVGATARLQVIASYQNGTTSDVSSLSTFTTSNASVAIVDTTGKITGVAAGSATITGKYQLLTTSVIVTISSSAPTVQSIAITPATISLQQGTTKQLQVTATLSNSTTQDVTSTATYTSSANSVATASSTGVLAAVSTGSAIITASYQGQSATVSVTVAAPTTTSLVLSSVSGKQPWRWNQSVASRHSHTDRFDHRGGDQFCHIQFIKSSCCNRRLCR